MYLTKSLAAQIRSIQRANYNALQVASPGPPRIAILLRAVDIRIHRATGVYRPRIISDTRATFNHRRDTWLGNAGVGTCFACARHRERCWHHIFPLMNGGTNARKNLTRICEECHTQIHPHMALPKHAIDEPMYHEARRLMQRFDDRPRLVKQIARTDEVH